MTEIQPSSPAAETPRESLRETILTVIYAVLIAFGIRTFAYEPFSIPSGSMVPTLLVGDYLFVSKLTYGYSRFSIAFGLPVFKGRIFFHEPERGDVVVFKLPRDNSTDYIKRVIGVPGDHIQMKEGRLYINDEMVHRERLDDYVARTRSGEEVAYRQYDETLPGGVVHRIAEEMDDGPLDNTQIFIVPEEKYFVMGDNRDNSLDSRVSPEDGGVGYVPVENFVGKARVLFFSVGGGAKFWQIWRWPADLRLSRFFDGVH